MNMKDLTGKMGNTIVRKNVNIVKKVKHIYD